MSSIHLINLLQGLAAVIADPNSNQVLNHSLYNPTAADKISLDDTLILLHTEFNREPNPKTYMTDKEYNVGDFKYAGREHFGQATVALMIGGPVTSRGIQGGIKLTDGNATTAEATEALTTTDIIAAGMMAAGINPIYPDNFLATDNFSQQINPGGTAYDTEILNRLRQKVFGLSALSNSTYTFG